MGEKSELDKLIARLSGDQKGLYFIERLKVKIIKGYLKRKSRGVCSRCNKKITGDVKLVVRNIDDLLNYKGQLGIRDVLGMVEVVCGDCEVKIINSMVKKVKSSKLTQFLNRRVSR